MEEKRTTAASLGVSTFYCLYPAAAALRPRVEGWSGCRSCIFHQSTDRTFHLPFLPFDREKLQPLSTRRSGLAASARSHWPHAALCAINATSSYRCTLDKGPIVPSCSYISLIRIHTKAATGYMDVNEPYSSLFLLASFSIALSAASVAEFFLPLQLLACGKKNLLPIIFSSPLLCRWRWRCRPRPRPPRLRGRRGRGVHCVHSVSLMRTASVFVFTHVTHLSLSPSCSVHTGRTRIERVSCMHPAARIGWLGCPVGCFDESPYVLVVRAAETRAQPVAWKWKRLSWVGNNSGECGAGGGGGDGGW